MKVLHILYQSLPDNAGSSIRSRDILISQKESGLTPIAITSPFQVPIDEKKNPELIYDIPYYRTYMGKSNEHISENSSSLKIKLKKIIRILNFVPKALSVAKNNNVDVVHAHATFFCGLTGWYVSKRLKVPFVYEVRSLWEERQLERNQSILTRIQVSIIRFLEKRCYSMADSVIAINAELKKALVKKGVNKNKIEIINNAVNLSLINKTDKSLKDSDCITFGYVGSISPIEGLDELIRVFSKLEAQGIQNKLLIYGSGSYKDELIILIKTLNCKNVELRGEIPPSKISEAYSTIDVIINPRKKLNITEKVTPLKPLEAMAYGKLVLASNVGGMKELIKDMETGILFQADNIANLEDRLRFILSNSNSQLMKKINNNAVKYVELEKSWQSNAIKYKDIYEKLKN